ncbi:hypothetical protein GCM10010207_76020 [Streptomyces atratus]|nr:hypothetical protein GCM10010207_76020 [Streptomyces atratus]
MTTELHGFTALVTGGASGIGLATATLLAERGADVAFLGLDPSGAPAPLRGFTADVSDATRCAPRCIWLEIVSLALDLLAWMPMLALTGYSRCWEPKNLRLRLFFAAAKKRRRALYTLPSSDSSVDPRLSGRRGNGLLRGRAGELTSDEKEELRRLRRENREQHQTIEILEQPRSSSRGSR